MQFLRSVFSPSYQVPDEHFVFRCHEPHHTHQHDTPFHHAVLEELETRDHPSGAMPHFDQRPAGPRPAAVMAPPATTIQIQPGCSGHLPENCVLIVSGNTVVVFSRDCLYVGGHYPVIVAMGQFDGGLGVD